MRSHPKLLCETVLPEYSNEGRTKSIRVWSVVLSILLLLLACNKLDAQTFATAGDYNTGTNWSPFGVPANNTSSTITVNASPTFNSGANNVAGAVTASNGITITVNSGASFIMNSFAGSGSGDNITIVISGNVTINGNFALHDHASITVKSGGSLTVTGNFTTHDNNALTVSGSLSVGGNFATHDSMTGTVNGTVNVTGSTNVHNSVTLSGTGGWSSSSCTDGSGTFCSSGVMPIVLKSFTATVSLNTIVVNWSTASEINFDYFNLEKSTNGKDFYSIDQVKGQGTTNEGHSYSIKDTQPTIGSNYYRLTSVDFDNFQQSFQIIAADFTGSKIFSIYPNPSDGKTISAVANFNTDGGSQVSIYNSIGTLIMIHSYDEPTLTITLENSLPSGIYIVKFVSEGYTQSVKLVVN